LHLLKLYFYGLIAEFKHRTEKKFVVEIMRLGVVAAEAAEELFTHLFERFVSKYEYRLFQKEHATGMLVKKMLHPLGIESLKSRGDKNKIIAKDYLHQSNLISDLLAL